MGALDPSADTQVDYVHAVGDGLLDVRDEGVAECAAAVVDERGAVSREQVVIMKFDARSDAAHRRRETHRLAVHADGPGRVAPANGPGDVRAVVEEQRPARIEETGSAEEDVMGDAPRGATGGDERMGVVDSRVDDADLHAREVADRTR